MAYERRVNIDREALCREVWAEPVTVVAKRYGISARFFAAWKAQSCKHVNAPLGRRVGATMRRVACVLVAAVVLLSALSEPVMAGSGGHGGGRGGHGGGKWHGGGGKWHGGGGKWGGHGPGGGRWAWGGRAWWGPAWWGPGWYGYPYAYGYPYPYAYAAPVVVPQAPQVYIEQTPPAPQPAPQQYWYYCEDSRTYYPYVRECPRGWMTVVPPSTAPP
jgi:hypothetical protein